MKEKDLLKEINTYVNEEKRVVTTAINVSFKDDFAINPIFAKFVGKARCSQEDNFDLELGKQISKNRAWIKYDNAMLKGIRAEINDVMDYLVQLKEEEDKYEKLIEKTTKKIEDLCESIDN